MRLLKGHVNGSNNVHLPQGDEPHYKRGVIKLTENIEPKNGEILFYTTDKGNINLGVLFSGETVWLSQPQMVELFESSKSNVSEHIKHVFDDCELEENAVVRNFRTTAADGKKYNVKHYNFSTFRTGLHHSQWCNSMG